MVPIGLSGYDRCLPLEYLPATRPPPGFITWRLQYLSLRHVWNSIADILFWFSCTSMFFFLINPKHQCCFSDRWWFWCRFTFLFWHNNNLYLYAHCGFYTDLRYVFPKGWRLISIHSKYHIYQQMHVKGVM
jgi:hypothetical protein